MRLIATSRVQNGTLLGRDVLTGRADGTPLLRAGVQLTPVYKDALLSAGVMAIYVDDETSAGIEIDSPIDEPTRVLATQAVANMQQIATSAIGQGDALDDDQRLDRALDSLADVTRRILAQIEECGGVALALGDLSAADGYTFQHSIDVAALGLIIGRQQILDHGWVDFLGTRRFDQIEARLTTLGVGLLLHDIGKMAIPHSILNKPGRLTAEEMALMRTHPRAGVDLLRGDRWDPRVKAVVLRHHERWDGSGYPDGRVGTKIHEMARVAAVADVYDAITSSRPYAAAKPAAVGVRAILEGAGTLYEPTVVESFRRVVTPFPAGTQIELSDGHQALVVRVPAEHLDRPVVRLIEDDVAIEDIALLDHPELTIVGWPSTQPSVESR